MAKVVADANGAHDADALWWALAIGADFGGHATAVGASANVVMLGIAKKPGTRSALGTSPARLPSSPLLTVTVTVAVPYVWLRYFA